jgi:hypothetical protein
MITRDQALGLIGGDLYGSEGTKIGQVGQVFLDDETDRPEWVTVHSGLFGTRESFVPLREARSGPGGLTVPYTKEQIKGAPTVDVGGGHLSQEEERQLYAYYGLEYVAPPPHPGQSTGTTADGGTPRPAVQPRAAGMESVEVARVRLRKIVVTDHVSAGVPVRHEEVRLEREPVSEDAADTTEGGGLSEEQYEIVLHAERPAVASELVPEGTPGADGR